MPGLPRESLVCPACKIARVPFRAGQRTATCWQCGARLGRRPAAAAQRNPGTSSGGSVQEQIAKAAKDYETFHQAKPELKKITLPPRPAAWMYLGRLVDFTYQAPRKSERGVAEDGKDIQWRHAIGDIGIPFLKVGVKPKLYISPDGKQLQVIGGSFHFDPRLGVLG